MQTILVPKEILDAFFGQNRHHLELLSTARWGCSGPKVVFLRNGNPRRLALKYGQTRVPISTQLENRHLLAQFIPHRLPEILSYCNYSEGEAMLMEAIDGPNLHEAVMLGLVSDQEVLHIVQSIMADFLQMWIKSRSAEHSFMTPRDPKIRLIRVKEAAIRSLLSLGIRIEDEVIVNNKSVGRPADLLSVLDTYSPPDFSVFCHSDLNADNFVVGSEGKWYVVDWEWVGRHDWRLCMSHLYGWWSSNATRLECRPVISRLGETTIRVAYELSSPSICADIQKLCIHACETVAKRLGDKGDWQRGLNLLVAALLLGDIRFIPNRGRVEYTIPLLGEGLRILSNLQPRGPEVE